MLLQSGRVVVYIQDEKLATRRIFCKSRFGVKMTFEVTKNDHPGAEKESCSLLQASTASCRSTAAIVVSSSCSPCTTVMRMLGTRTQELPGAKRLADVYIEGSVSL